MIDFMLFWGFADRQTDRLTDICTSRVTFATENNLRNQIHDNISGHIVLLKRAHQLWSTDPDTSDSMYQVYTGVSGHLEQDDNDDNTDDSLPGPNSGSQHTTPPLWTFRRT